MFFFSALPCALKTSSRGDQKKKSACNCPVPAMGTHGGSNEQKHLNTLIRRHCLKAFYWLPFSRRRRPGRTCPHHHWPCARPHPAHCPAVYLPDQHLLAVGPSRAMTAAAAAAAFAPEREAVKLTGSSDVSSKGRGFWFFLSRLKRVFKQLGVRHRPAARAAREPPCAAMTVMEMNTGVCGVTRRLGNFRGERVNVVRRDRKLL